MDSKVSYTESLEGITPRELRGFFVGWPDPPIPETHLQLLRNSSHILLAVGGESGRVVGFITAVSDGVLSAYIPLLEVLPEYRGEGIGGELARRMLKKLENLYMVDLLCDRSLVPFYRRLGMLEAEDHRVSAMMVRDPERQSGRRPGA